MVQHLQTGILAHVYTDGPLQARGSDRRSNPVLSCPWFHRFSSEAQPIGPRGVRDNDFRRDISASTIGEIKGPPNDACTLLCAGTVHGWSIVISQVASLPASQRRHEKRCTSGVPSLQQHGNQSTTCGPSHPISPHLISSHLLAWEATGTTSVRQAWGRRETQRGVLPTGPRLNSQPSSFILFFFPS